MGTDWETRGGAGATSTDAQDGAGDGARSKARKDLAGLEYDQQLAALEPGDQGRGSGTIVASAARQQVAWDGGFTPDLVDELKSSPDASLDEVLDAIADREVKLPIGGIQQATMLRMGGSQEAEEAPAKEAVYVANTNYTHAGRLPQARPDAKRMQSALSPRGYDGPIVEDQTADGLRATYSDAVQQAGKTPGSSLVLYFAGHGLGEGLVGVNADKERGEESAKDASGQRALVLAPEYDGPWAAPEDRVEAGADAGVTDVFPHGELIGLVDKATAQSTHVRVVLDACHSGAATDLARTEYLNELAKNAPGDTSPELVAAVQRLAGAKETLRTFLNTCREEQRSRQREADAARRAKTSGGQSDAGGTRDLLPAVTGTFSHRLNERLIDAGRKWWDQEFYPQLQAIEAQIEEATGQELALPDAGANPMVDYATIQDQIDDAVNDAICAIHAE